MHVRHSTIRWRSVWGKKKNVIRHLRSIKKKKRCVTAVIYWCEWRTQPRSSIILISWHFKTHLWLHVLLLTTSTTWNFNIDSSLYEYLHWNNNDSSLIDVILLPWKLSWFHCDRPLCFLNRLTSKSDCAGIWRCSILTVNGVIYTNMSRWELDNAQNKRS